jgi:GNAT superfamily N-acetyltransferase
MDRPLGYVTDRFVPPENVLEPIEGGVVVRSPTLPSFWFGNMIFLDAPPAPDEVAGWLERWPSLVTAPRPERIVLEWETPEPSLTPGLRAVAEDLSLDVEDVAILRLGDLRPGQANGTFAARPARTDLDWAGALAVATAELEGDQVEFSTLRQVVQRERARARRGDWWVGELDGTVVASAGIYWDDAGRIARYQAVDTLAAARGRGCASALLTAMARDVRERLPDLEALVIAADAGGAPERLYRRLGFETASWQAALVGAPPA